MLQFFSPAKINLFLRVFAKRPDGYHNLSSVFQTITLGDTLIIELSDVDVFTCSDPHLPMDASNLVVKAVRLFRKKTGIVQPLKIHLTKIIPSQAGFGGGSSNAATILWACNEINKTRIATNLLAEWSAEIGSDIPFFFSEGTAYCTGRGESVQSLSALQQPKAIWIVKPPHIGLSTPDIYRRLGCTTFLDKEYFEEDMIKFLSGTLPLFNDLEKPAFEVKPELKELKIKLLESGFETVVMTGSGSALVCIGNANPPDLSELQMYKVSFLNRSSTCWYESHSR